jgi:ABC-type sugar transport system ATPase subunit
MNLLCIERVSKRVGSGARARTALREVSLEVDRGEYVVVWGLRGSGRSTLLRVAGGLEPADSGVVRFEGRVLKGSGVELGEGIGYCYTRFAAGEGRSALDMVMMGLLARGVAPADARASARAALERCELSERGQVTLGELDSAERLRLALSRSLVLEPRLLIVDEPTSGVELMERDAILLLLRSISDEGIAVLASASEPTSLSGADRTLALGGGQLRGELEPHLANVVELHGASRAAAAG